MRWKGRRQSDNVEDLRGQSTNQSRSRGGTRFRIPSGTRVRRAGGGGLSGIIMLVVLFFVLKACGIDPSFLLNGGLGGGQVVTQAPSSGQRVQSSAREEEMKKFVSVVLAETENTWQRIFAEQGLRYEEPKLRLFRGGIRSACGSASSASGPFYCPADKSAYIDLSFYDELARRFGAPGDFAQAYVLAHEVGHHVQNLIGVLPRFNEMRQTMGKVEENRMSVRVELQADCFAGIWANDAQNKGLLERGDIDEALNAAKQIGDDTLQRKSQGYVVPESFNHGTSAQRRTWFMRGFETGRLDACDTFNADI